MTAEPADLRAGPVPRHVGIIMDGNGRWARQRGRPASFGHRAGARIVKTVMGGCEEIGVEVLSIYAFSTENWTRPRREVGFLMRLFHETLDREFAEIQQRNIRVVFSGRRDELDPRMRKRMQDAEEKTKDNSAGVLNVCLNYGGRAEVVDAVKAATTAGDQLDEASIARHLYQAWLPEPDLIIRTAGEKRMSNFLLWQAAYAELYVTERLWPDFTVDDLKEAVADYQGRVRRFGGRPESEVGG
ncbi:MAG TPA: polyprenyl diphosphate synthase [Candidatus Dormibacteraeota bacterium]